MVDTVLKRESSIYCLVKLKTVRRLSEIKHHHHVCNEDKQKCLGKD